MNNLLKTLLLATVVFPVFGQTTITLNGNPKQPVSTVFQWETESDSTATPAALAEYNIITTNAAGTITSPAVHALSTSGITANYSCDFHRYLNSGSNYQGWAYCHRPDGYMNIYATTGTYARNAEVWTTIFTLDRFGDLSAPARIQAGSYFQAPLYITSVVTLSSSATPSINAANGFQTITLSANATPTISGIAAGQRVTIQVCQPASGGPYTWTWPASIVGAFPITSVAGQCTAESFQSFNGSTLQIDGRDNLGLLSEVLYTPASSTATCTAGQFADDANYHYVCTAANTWKRVALVAF